MSAPAPATPSTEPPEPLVRRYRPQHLAVFTPAERERFLPGLAPGDPVDEGRWLEVARRVAWELLYRIEPDLYERLIEGERLHPALWAWLPDRVGRAVEVGAGTGRLTLDLAPRCDRLVAVEPAAPMRQRLERKLRERGLNNVEVREGFFDDLGVPPGWADLVIACSAHTPDPAHGGDPGLSAMERACAPGGLVVIVWPPDPGWLAARGYEHVSFPGDMAHEFRSPEEAVELARIFYPQAVEEVRRRGQARVPYEVLGIPAPRDLCFKRVA